MRATVLEDKSLERHAGRFVWLSIDTEDSKNATYLEQHPFEAVPTFQVLDASTARVAYRWIGAVDRTRWMACSRCGMSLASR